MATLTSSPIAPRLSRRSFLQTTTSGTAGLLTWQQGWGQPQRARAQQGQPSGQMIWALHITIAPTWFDPAETPGVITPFMFLYAMHDALMKPMPGNMMAPSLATRWSESPDGLTYDFTLREGVTFHNGDSFTAEDVRYSFTRYKGSGSSELKKRVKTVEIVTPHQVRFRLYEPWPDFLTFFGTPATAAAWVVPHKYVEKVGDEAFRQHPIGAGPYRFLSHQPGIELVLEANSTYWRQTPHVQRLVMCSVPEATTRLAMLKQGEADVAYALYGPLVAEVQQDPSLKLEPVHPPGTQWFEFTQQDDPHSPWHDKRVRLAANHAINRQALNDAETLGHSLLTGSIIPRKFDFALPLEPYAYDPKKAKQLLTEAGYPDGFDAGECSGDSVYSGVLDSLVKDLGAIGIRLKVLPLERAAAFAAKYLAFHGNGAYGNAASRLNAFVYSKGSESWIKETEIDAWYTQQLTERDRQKREVLLHKIQQKLYDEARMIPMWELGFLCASGPRVAISGLSRIPLFAYSGPYEEVQLKGPLAG